MAARVRVFIACSLDGFIAGPEDDLSWLPEPGGDSPQGYGYAKFMAEVGALLMGRNTYAVVAGFKGEWPYGERPVLVATHRPFDPPQPGVRLAAGPIAAMVRAGLEAADGRDLYLDGGALIRQALDAGLVDELTVTLIPVVLGAGSPLFAGVEQRRTLELLDCERFEGGIVQLRYRPRQC